MFYFAISFLSLSVVNQFPFTNVINTSDSDSEQRQDTISGHLKRKQKIQPYIRSKIFSFLLLIFRVLRKHVIRIIASFESIVRGRTKLSIRTCLDLQRRKGRSRAARNGIKLHMKLVHTRNSIIGRTDVGHCLLKGVVPADVDDSRPPLTATLGRVCCPWANALHSQTGIQPPGRPHGRTHHDSSGIQPSSSLF